MYLNRAGTSAIKAHFYTQARRNSLNNEQTNRLDRIFNPSLVMITVAGLSMSLYGLHQLQQQCFHLDQQKRSSSAKALAFK